MKTVDRESCPLRRVVPLVLEHHPDRPLADLRWVSAWSCHRSILSRTGASNIPGAVHDHLIIVNERHLRLVLREYVAHYNHVRPHQALELWAPDDRRPRSPPRSEGQVVGRPILGGLHHEYERLAA